MQDSEAQKQLFRSIYRNKIPFCTSHPFFSANFVQWKWAKQSHGKVLFQIMYSRGQLIHSDKWQLDYNGNSEIEKMLLVGDGSCLI